MLKRLTGSGILSLVVALLLSAPVFATKSVSSANITPLGNDVSYPQCGKTLPTTQTFGVVGVNGGLATTTNDCLGAQLQWAWRSSGTQHQPKAGLYVNTANPGGLGTASWPKNNVDPVGATTQNPYGDCDGSDSLSCAWQYGWNRAVEDVQSRFVPAAQSAAIDATPATYRWWLDVETSNTWKTSGNLAKQSNTADLEGMTAYFESQGATVGLYSTASQWGSIVGTITSGSNLNGLINWRPGGANLNTAKQACTAAPLTPGGQVLLTQYIANRLDYDYSCVN